MDFGNNKKVNYFYDGAGGKLSKVVWNGANPPVYTEYMGQFVHQYTMGGVSSLKYIITPEGRIINKGTNAAPVLEFNQKVYINVFKLFIGLLNANESVWFGNANLLILSDNNDNTDNTDSSLFCL